MSLVMKQQRTASAPNGLALSRRPERVRFADFNFTRTPSGQCAAEVSLEWDNMMFSGRAIGQSSPLGDFRISAEAALRALEDFAKDVMHFELLGIKHVR